MLYVSYTVFLDKSNLEKKKIIRERKSFTVFIGKNPCLMDLHSSNPCCSRANGIEGNLFQLTAFEMMKEMDLLNSNFLYL